MLRPASLGGIAVDCHQQAEPIDLKRSRLLPLTQAGVLKDARRLVEKLLRELGIAI